ncbi:hypothetical protein [Carnimonas bestiolae]|uniref:hypothetical protein n=1 Tax=Carnimonas bestiolae TaxID=3402172 RepID=UPI003EDC19A2
MNPYRLQLGLDLQPLVLAHANSPAELTREVVKTALTALDSGADHVVIEASAASAQVLDVLATLMRERLAIRVSAEQALALAKTLRPAQLCLLDTPDSATLEALVEQAERYQIELFYLSHGEEEAPMALANACQGVVIDLYDWSQQRDAARDAATETIEQLIDSADQHDHMVYFRALPSLYCAEAAATIGGVSAIELGTAIFSSALADGLATTLRSARELLTSAQQAGLEIALEQHDHHHAEGEHASDYAHCGCHHH